MSEQRQDSMRQFPGDSPNYWSEYPERPLRYSRTGSGLKYAGLALLGLGAVAWYYLGADVRRYLKIRNM